MPVGPFDPANYKCIVELLDTDGVSTLAVIRNLSVGIDFLQSGEFEWLRQGGCGQGSFQIEFTFNTLVRVGQYIRVKYNDANTMYLGRIESTSAEWPRGHSVQTFGLMTLLSDRSIGGFDATNDIRDPHLYAAEDLFPSDPDRSKQEWTVVDSYHQIVQDVFDRYISPLGITLGAIEVPDPVIPVQSMVFRGQETIAQVMRNLAVACNGAGWGINAGGQFFFTRPRTNVVMDFQQGVDIERLSRSEDRSMLCNRVLIVGDMIYDAETKTHWRFQRNYFDSDSWSQYGERRRELYLPWIRTINEAVKWKNQFFAKYAQPVTRFSVTTAPRHTITFPWIGYYGIKDFEGNYITQDVVESVRVDITTWPRLTFTTGPEDLQYPEPPEAERWEQPLVLGDFSGIGSELTDHTATGDSGSSEAPSSGEGGSQPLTSGAPSSGEGGSQPLTSGAPSSGEGGSQVPSSGAPSSGEGGSQPPSSGAPSSGEGGSQPPSSGEGGSQPPSSGAPSSDELSSGALSSGEIPSSGAASSGEGGSQPASSDALSSGAPSEGEGSEKSTAIVPASWSPTGYTALFVSEAPEVRFDDVLVVSMEQVNQVVPIDARFAEVCCQDSIEVCGCTCNLPVLVGTRAWGSEVFVTFAEQRPEVEVRLVVRLTGIRKGFQGHRFPDRTQEQFEANERFIESAYPGFTHA